MNDDLNIPEFLRRLVGEVRAPSQPLPPPEQPQLINPSTPAPRSAAAERVVAFKATNKYRDMVISEIEGMIDDVMFGTGTPFSVYDMMIVKDVPTRVAQQVVARYTPYLEELREIKPGCDPQLWEGYSEWNRADINRMVDLVSAIVSEAARYVGNKRAVRVSPRKHRKPRAQRQIRDIKYLREYADLKLVSLDPLKIIGAMTLWTYDVKRRLLCMYVSNSRTGFTMSGTTLKQVDADASMGKRLRKPQETLTQLLSASKTAAVEVIKELRTKASPTTGRINANTIILRAQGHNQICA